MAELNMKKPRTEFQVGRCRGDRWENTAPSPTTDVPDELLELVFLRLPSSLHLIHVACTCKSWRRVIANGGFLRRFRAIHPRPGVAGHYRVDEYKCGPCPPGRNPVFTDAQPDDTSLDLRPQHFSLDFLPACDSGLWDLADSRGGILLLCERITKKFWTKLRRIVVCDTMARRWSRVIAPPAFHNCCLIGAFLLDNDADEAGGRISLTNFKITVVLYDNGIAKSCVFSSSNGNGGWTVSKEINLGGSSILFLGHVAESIYWTTVRDILILDKDVAELKLTSILLPSHVWVYTMYSRSQVVGCHDGTVRIAVLQRHGHVSLNVLIQAEGSDEWVHEKSIQVPQLIPEVQADGGEYILTKIVSATEGSVTLGTEEGVGLVSVDLATMEFKRVALDRNKYHGPAYMYELSWPPTIRACLP